MPIYNISLCPCPSCAPHCQQPRLGQVSECSPRMRKVSMCDGDRSTGLSDLGPLMRDGTGPLIDVEWDKPEKIMNVDIYARRSQSRWLCRQPVLQLNPLHSSTLIPSSTEGVKFNPRASHYSSTPTSNPSETRNSACRSTAFSPKAPDFEHIGRYSHRISTQPTGRRSSNEFCRVVESLGLIGSAGCC